MSAKVLLPLAILAAGLAWLIPILTHLLPLANFIGDLSAHIPHARSLLPKCKYAHPDTLTGCEDMVLVDTNIFTACLSRDMSNALKWGRSAHEPVSHIPGDVLYRWDLTTDTVHALPLRHFPRGENHTAADASFLGLDAHRLPNGTVALWLVNLLPGRPSVDKFHWDASSDTAVHIARFDVSAHSHHPNNVLAVPERDGENAFYLTTDHGTREPGLVRELEYVTLRPWTHVTYHSSSTGFVRVLSGLVGTNGLAADRTTRISDGGLVFVSELMMGRVLVLRETAPGRLEMVQKVDTGILGDNPSVYAGEMWIPSGVHMMDLQTWLRGGVTRPPGSVVARVNVRELGEGFYGKGFTVAPRVERVWTDPEGVLANASTTVVYREYERGEEEEEEEEGRGRGELFVTGLKSRGVLRCENID